MAGGDARRALTALEAAAGVALDAAPAGPYRRRAVADHARPGRAGGRPRGGALRPGRRPALRRGQRADQVDARQRRRRRAALPGPDAGGGGGPPVHRPPHRHRRQRGRRHGRPDRPADRRRRAARRRPDRHAGGADHPGAGGGPQRARARSRTPATPASTPRSPTSGPGKGGPVPPHLRGSGYAGADPPRARRGLPLRPRRPGRSRRPAVPPGRPGAGRRLLPADRPRLRGAARPAVEVAPRAGSAVGNDLSHKGSRMLESTRDVWHIYAVSWRGRHISAPGDS